MDRRIIGGLVLIGWAAVSCNGGSEPGTVADEPQRTAQTPDNTAEEIRDSGFAADAGEGSRIDGDADKDAASPPASASASPDAAASPRPEPMTDTRRWFSFFTTSEAGIRSLAPDPENGFGGDLGGLTGADKICETLARRANPGDTKTWRAFLSATDDGNGNEVHAIERIGSGPWYDFNQRLFAMNVAGLLPTEGESGGRPTGAEPQLAQMFTDENGDPVSADTELNDNHDILTGTGTDGRLDGGKRETCQDWTSSDPELNGKPRIGHAWPRSATVGRNWITEHHAGGCGAGIDTTKGLDNGSKTVGSGGGYGGLYCFALAE